MTVENSYKGKNRRKGGQWLDQQEKGWAMVGSAGERVGNSWISRRKGGQWLDQQEKVRAMVGTAARERLQRN